MFFLAISPFLLFIALLVFFRQSLLRVSFYTLVLTIFLALFVWKMNYSNFIIANFKGFFVALDIFFIIFGALYFLEIVQKHGIIKNIISHLERISPDYRIITIVLAWMFEAFLEATAGFGVPCTVVAPILLTMGGISPIQAIIISLLGNSTSVAFGAVGTPSKIGFAGFNDPQIAIFTSLYNFVGILVPVFMAWFLVSDKKNKWQQFREILPFSIISGLALIVPMYIFSFFGEEFPSLFGSIVGMILIILVVKSGLASPKHIHQFSSDDVSQKSLFIDFFPYLILTTLLVLGKFTIGRTSLPLPFINHSINLFNPGFAFIIAGIATQLFISHRQNYTAFKLSFKKTISPFAVIIFMSIMVQLMTNSGKNISGALSMILLISQQFRSSLLPLWAPFIGFFGSFITGSATVSNLLFGGFVNAAAKELGFFAPKVLGAQLSGAAAGNMVALADMLTAEAVVGLKNQELAVVKRLLIPTLFYVLLVGLACYFL